MFQLFKKSAATVAQAFKSEAQIIEEIHAAVDGAEDALLKEAEFILSQPIAQADSKIIQRAERLEKLGFVMAPEVAKSSEARQNIAREKIKKEMSGQLAELIQYYKQTYPFMKFLTVEVLDSICEKYNLIHAPVQSFKGVVPEKNLLEIERAQALKGCDIEMPAIRFVTNRVGFSWEADTNKKVKAFLKYLKLDGFVSIEDIRNVIPERCGPWNRRQFIDVYLSSSEKLKDHTWLYMLWEHHGKNSVQFNWQYSGIEKQNREGLFICAPAKEFDVTGLTAEKNGFVESQVTLIPVRDPVVYRYVRGGVQVLSKWGLEASDPALLNEVDN
jgi:hypothetical protein